MPMEFEGHNTVFAKNQKEYLPLPAHRDSRGVVTTCWAATCTPRRNHMNTIDLRNMIVSGLNFVRRSRPTNEALRMPDLAQRIYNEAIAAHYDGHDFTAEPLPQQEVMIQWIVDRINKEIAGPPIDDIEFMV